MILPVAVDPRMAAHLAMQIDGCEFRTVTRYFRSPSGAMQMVVLVQLPYALEEVAAIYAAPSMRDGDATLQSLLRAGVLKFGVDDLSRVQAGHRDHVVLLDRIAADHACRVIYLPPCYVVQLGSRTADCPAARGGHR